MPELPLTFHPVIQTWFTETYGTPTAVQAEAWPIIEQGENVLALAPTGSGKTLTAFLSAISRFCPGSDKAEALYPADKLTVLYVSPLKALNEDIKRNLLEPLNAIRKRFEQAGLSFPAVHAETRSGDTPQSQRRRFLSHPPSILALTPESLAILLLSPKGRQTLSTVKYLILDEIHAVLGNKRGAYLSCQIDRLAQYAGEFQRISLSATVCSPEIAADFIGGLDSNGKKRTVNIIAPPAEKQIELSVEYSDDISEINYIDKYGKRYGALITYIVSRIKNGSTILVFTDSRRRAERLAFFINQESPGATAAFAHHGSLAKELRRSVEQRLARGELPCVVATASLELGIDIGSVDEVILAGSPGIVSQALQRIGRSGHSVGKVSRGRLFPFHGMDLLLATALKEAVDARDIEEIHPIENPLDILAQLILALCTEQNRNIDELYSTLKKFYIFRNLNHDSYLRTIRMLAGLGSTGKLADKVRMREIKPRIWMDAVNNEIGALDGTLLLLYASGGVIANRGMYSLRLADGTKIGELDEEFVWERRIRDQFHFGGRGWQITAINAEAVEVVPLDNKADYIPFWHADIVFRSPRLTKRVLSILDRRNEDFKSEPEKAPETALDHFLDSQQAAQRDIPLAGSSRIVIEIIDSPENQGDFYHVIIHSFRGGAINYPLSLALAQELEEVIQLRIESFSNDDLILLLIPRAAGKADELLRSAFIALNNSGGGGLSRGERLFRNRLEVSGVFGANFREAAERSLLLPKAGFGKRTPLWITRQRSKRLFDAVSAEDGFPVTAEAWRCCLQDMFDMDGFRDLLGAINDQSIDLSFFKSNDPSPFSRDMVWQETNSLMYVYDEREDTPGLSGKRTATLSDRVIEEALGDAALRPILARELVENFTSRLRRELPGWAPDDPLSLCEWVKERIAIPQDEWETLCAILPEQLQQELTQPFIKERIKMIKRNDNAIASMIHREWESQWLSEDAIALIGPWLRYEGTISLDRIANIFGIDVNQADSAVNALIEVDEVISNVKTEGQQSLLCDRENLEMLLRLSRRKARPEIKERPASMLIPFLALRQGLLINETEKQGVAQSALFSKLAAWSAPAKLWETELLPCRSMLYYPEIIDTEIREGRLVWYSRSKEKIGLCKPDDLDLVLAIDGQSGLPEKYEKPAHGTQAFEQAIHSGFFDRPRDFWEIKEKISAAESAGTTAVIVQTLWQQVWQGRLSSDTFDSVRRGIESNFTFKKLEPVEQITSGTGLPLRTHIPRALRNRWRDGAPIRGEWFSLVINEPSDNAIDFLDEECRNRDRVRLLLSRWGVLCRPLLERESAPFSWSGLLPAMRRMELSGELCAGRFFNGISSLQFASPAIARELEHIDSICGSCANIYWMNAVDPASPAGLDIEGFDSRLPARLASSRLYFRGEKLIAVTNRGGKEQHIYISPDDPDLGKLIELIKIPRSRKVFPETKISIETINGQDAARSDYTPSFRSAGFVSDRGKLCCW